MAAATGTHSSFLQLQKYIAPEWTSSLKLVVRDIQQGMRATATAAVAAAVAALAEARATAAVAVQRQDDSVQHMGCLPAAIHVQHSTQSLNLCAVELTTVHTSGGDKSCNEAAVARY
jgi:hypothetical protein